MDKMRQTESVMKEMLRLRKALDRLDTKIRKEPELMASSTVLDYMNELAYKIRVLAAAVTEAVHDRTSHNA